MGQQYNKTVAHRTQSISSSKRKYESRNDYGIIVYLTQFHQRHIVNL